MNLKSLILFIIIGAAVGMVVSFIFGKISKSILEIDSSVVAGITGACAAAMAGWGFLGKTKNKVS